MVQSNGGVEDGKHRTTRPALDVLDRDQDRLLYGGDTRRSPVIRPLGDGFETYWHALSWYQAAAVRTLGHVDRVMECDRLMPEAAITEHLILPRNTENSAYVRRRLVERMDSVCDLAYRQFRERANEHVQGDGTDTYEDVDPDEEENPLMRPAFRRMDRGQASVLQTLWFGFDTREDLGRWVRSLTSVTNGEKPSGLLEDIVSSQPILAAMLDRRSSSAKMTRYRFAVSQVLPLFVTASATLHGGEQSQINDSGFDWKNG